MKAKGKAGTERECEYCEAPERYNLDPARQEPTREERSPHAIVRPVAWHYETIVYCRDVPRARVRCRKNGYG